MIMIIITILTMNVEYIWLTPLNAMQIKVSSAVAYDFNQLLYDYAVCAPPRPVKKEPSPSGVQCTSLLCKHIRFFKTSEVAGNILLQSSSWRN